MQAACYQTFEINITDSYSLSRGKKIFIVLAVMPCVEWQGIVFLVHVGDVFDISADWKQHFVLFNTHKVNKIRNEQNEQASARSTGVWIFTAYLVKFRTTNESWTGTIDVIFPDFESTEELGAREKSRLDYHHTRQLTVASFQQR